MTPTNPTGPAKKEIGRTIATVATAVLSLFTLGFVIYLAIAQSTINIRETCWDKRVLDQAVAHSPLAPKERATIQAIARQCARLP